MSFSPFSLPVIGSIALLFGLSSCADLSKLSSGKLKDNLGDISTVSAKLQVVTMEQPLTFVATLYGFTGGDCQGRGVRLGQFGGINTSSASSEALFEVDVPANSPYLLTLEMTGEAGSCYLSGVFSPRSSEAYKATVSYQQGQCQMRLFTLDKSSTGEMVSFKTNSFHAAQTCLPEK